MQVKQTILDSFLKIYTGIEEGLLQLLYIFEKDYFWMEY